MSSLRKMLETRKANIMAEAERKVAEIDRDIEQLERLTAKYGLSVTEQPKELGATMAPSVSSSLLDIDARAPIKATFASSDVGSERLG